MSLFISNYIPSECIGLDKRFSQAGSNFIDKLMRCLQNMEFYHSMYLGLDPDRHKKILTSKYRGSYVKSKYFFNKTKFAKILNIIFATVGINKICYNSHEKNIWYYNMVAPELILSALINKYFLKKNIYILLADYDTHNRILARLQNSILRSADGIISLRGLSTKISCNNNIVIHGITTIKGNNMLNRQDMIVKKKKFLFSGMLSEKLGLSLILEAFAKLPEHELIVTGKGELGEKAELYARKYPNIKYYSFLPYDDYLKLLQVVNTCFSLRNPDYFNNRYEFPSKIIEYLEFGKLVITNIEYEKLPKELYYKINYSLADLISSIRFSGNTKNLKNINIQLRQNFGCSVWKEAVKKIEIQQIPKNASI